MSPQLLRARHMGSLAIRGHLYAVTLSSKGEIRAACRILRRHAREAARSALAYMAQGGKAPRRPTSEEARRFLVIQKAHILGGLVLGVLRSLPERAEIKVQISRQEESIGFHGYRQQPFRRRSGGPMLPLWGLFFPILRGRTHCLQGGSIVSQRYHLTSA
jgi:hypothetical protein